MMIIQYSQCKGLLSAHIIIHYTAQDPRFSLGGSTQICKCLPISNGPFMYNLLNTGYMRLALAIQVVNPAIFQSCIGVDLTGFLQCVRSFLRACVKIIIRRHINFNLFF